MQTGRVVRNAVIAVALAITVVMLGAPSTSAKPPGPDDARLEGWFSLGGTVHSSTLPEADEHPFLQDYRFESTCPGRRACRTVAVYGGEALDQHVMDLRRVRPGAYRGVGTIEDSPVYECTYVADGFVQTWIAPDITETVHLAVRATKAVDGVVRQIRGSSRSTYSPLVIADLPPDHPAQCDGESDDVGFGFIPLDQENETLSYYGARLRKH